MKSGDLETAQKIIGELSKLYEESKICAYDEKISALKAKIKYNRDKIDECKANIDGADKVFESKVENVEDNKEKRLAEIENRVQLISFSDLYIVKLEEKEVYRACYKSCKRKNKCYG